MTSLQQMLENVNKSLKEPFDWGEIDKAIVELHNKLAEPRWAIEDEALRHETEKLLIQMASRAYIKRHLESRHERKT